MRLTSISWMYGILSFLLMSTALTLGHYQQDEYWKIWYLAFFFVGFLIWAATDAYKNDNQ